jgi:dienelactone hydrolase
MSAFAPLRRHLSVAALVLLTVLAACSNGGDGADDRNAASERGPGPPFRVSTVTENFVDPSRSAEGLADRPLVTTISYPRSGDGPFPLVVFAHGLMDHPRDFSGLATAWAEAGYVVAAPAFPLSNADAPGGPTPADFANQPGDVTFVIDEVDRLSRQEGHALEDRVDTDQVGVAGHGLGVTTVLGTTFNTCCLDERIDAAIAMAGILIDLDGTYDFTAIPMLMLYSAADQYIAPNTGPEIYEMALAPKLLVTVTNGTHWAPYRNDPDPADDTVTAATTDFWNVYLAGSTESLDNLLDHAAVDGVTVLEHQTE